MENLYHPGLNDARAAVERMTDAELLSQIDSLYGRETLRFGDGHAELLAEALRQTQLEFRNNSPGGREAWERVELHGKIARGRRWTPVNEVRVTQRSRRRRTRRLSPRRLTLREELALQEAVIFRRPSPVRGLVTIWFRAMYTPIAIARRSRRGACRSHPISRRSRVPTLACVSHGV